MGKKGGGGEGGKGGEGGGPVPLGFGGFGGEQGGGGGGGGVCFGGGGGGGGGGGCKERTGWAVKSDRGMVRTDTHIVAVNCRIALCQRFVMVELQV